MVCNFISQMDGKDRDYTVQTVALGTSIVAQSIKLAITMPVLHMSAIWNTSCSISNPAPRWKTSKDIQSIWVPATHMSPR